MYIFTQTYMVKISTFYRYIRPPGQNLGGETEHMIFLSHPQKFVLIEYANLYSKFSLFIGTYMHIYVMSLQRIAHFIYKKIHKHIHDSDAVIFIRRICFPIARDIVHIKGC